MNYFQLLLPFYFCQPELISCKIQVQLSKDEEGGSSTEAEEEDLLTETEELGDVLCIHDDGDI